MNGERHALAAGQLVFLPSGVYHRNEVVSSPYAKFLGIHFDFFDELAIQTEADMVVNEEAVQLDKFGEEAVAESFAPLSETPVYTPSLACVQLMEQIVHEFTMRPPGYELACKALMLNVLSMLLRSRSAREAAEGASVHGPKIAALMQQIEADPAEAWTNRELARRLSMNEDHMAKLFKQVAGMPPGEFVGSIRHREARRLLRETDLPVETVGERVGYRDIHYFSRIFRRHEGISPREYRKLSRIL
jgi:AraC-like DNA-binding protein